MDFDKLEEILEIAREVAWGATDILRAYYRGEIQNKELDIKSDPVTAADLAVNHYILETLQKKLASEEFGYLSEETYQEAQTRLPQEWVWIIDPLDGTRDFIDKTGEYAIHLALTYRGRPVLAVVPIPEAEKIYYAIAGKGTYVENRDGKTEKIKVSDKKGMEELYLVVSRTHRDDRFQKLIEELPVKGKNYVGSVGCKIVDMLEKRSDVYIALSGKSAAKEWDFAAPELILTEAGGKFSYFNGDLTLYNKTDVKMWGGLIASNGHCHEALCQKATEILAEIDQ